MAETRRLDRTRRRLEPLIRRVMHGYWRFARGLTLGVRAVVLDGQGRVFLVQHTYVAGWHLPGGGVEPGETMADALRRELKEEGNIDCIGAPELHGVYFNRRVSRRDHVAVFVVREFRQNSAPVPNHEIVAHGFFSPNALPPETSLATRARIVEVLEGKPLSPDW
jgi:8-oxo-dGTP pyrophosphatase MutT (NUDIX family)